MLGRVTADAVGGLPLPGLRNAIDAATGPDHALWFTAIDGHGRDRIGRAAAGGRIVTFPVPGGASVKNIVSRAGPRTVGGRGRRRRPRRHTRPPAALRAPDG
jgi:hypothetical protein